MNAPNMTAVCFCRGWRNLNRRAAPLCRAEEGRAGQSRKQDAAHHTSRVKSRFNSMRYTSSRHHRLDPKYLRSEEITADQEADCCCDVNWMDPGRLARLLLGGCSWRHQ